MTLVAALCQFPAEINNVIFSYLDMKQLLECLAVCRQWRDNIPFWIETQERTLQLSMSQLDNAHPPLQYIGRVVQGIQLAPWRQEVNYQQVIVNLVALDLPHVDTLQLYFMPAKGSSVIEASKAWYQLGTKLRRLLLSLKHPTRGQFDVSPLLRCCPFLTHLAIDYPHFSEPYLKYIGQGRQLQLHYLKFRAHIEMQDLLSLVRRCPELRYLRIGWNHSMDLKQIFDACPSLKGVGVNTRVFESDDPWWKDRRHMPMATRRSPTTASIQELDMYVKFEDLYLQIAAMLNHHCEHLKRLYLDINIDNWDGRIKQHDLDTLEYDPLPALEEFEYHAYQPAPAKASFVIPLLKKCPNLKSIYINTREAGPIYRALVGFHLPHLRCLTVSDTDRDMDGLEDLLFSIANTNTPLERFIFKGDVFRSHWIYQALSQISSLRHIELDDFEPNVFKARKRDKKIMTQCLNRLHGDGVTSTPATRNLESIDFFHVEGFMTVDAFGSLRKIFPLKRVAFHRCGPMSERGLRLLVDREPPLEYLEMHLSSRTMDDKSLEPILAYARTKIPIIRTPRP
ncbi:hypothetical protein O0I10_009093 [Lichtheimia ornata]|uniref:F-box domain-containing protein n=1 Tax=Lichtheimia ornata TaxID=688661 RepID=A0AAD7UXR6_9FUNG|nr:uncharacterized protein O0I10_009093 [Lichtheimia ornata]KAJ8655225.1 hypothetical protein O0I10_009093 [Lichtheimia ornata]